VSIRKHFSKQSHKCKVI